jgi:hypothetical protein
MVRKGSAEGQWSSSSCGQGQGRVFYPPVHDYRGIYKGK